MQYDRVSLGSRHDVRERCTRLGLGSKRTSSLRATCTGRGAVDAGHTPLKDLPGHRRIVIRAIDVRSDDPLVVQTLYEEAVLQAPWRKARSGPQPTFAQLSEGETVRVATDGAGTLQGVVSVFERDSFVHHLYVGVRFQQRGVGTALLADLESTLPKPWRLKCVEANATALVFYVRRGWMEVDRGDGEDGPFVVLQRG